jgi:hypothetical protein
VRSQEADIAKTNVSEGQEAQIPEEATNRAKATMCAMRASTMEDLRTVAEPAHERRSPKAAIDGS